MKTILALTLLAVTAGCYTAREIEVEMVQAELVKIDTINRSTDSKKMLTWRDQDNIDYVSYAGMYENYTLGLRLLVMRRR